MVDQNQYEVVEKVLKNYKGVGNSEAKLFTRLLERPKFTIDDVKTILKELKEKKANSRAYQLIDSLKKNELIDEIKKSNPKTYRPIHPRIILEVIQKEHAGFETAFGLLEQAYDSYSESTGEQNSCYESFSTEAMMLSKIQELLRRGFEIKKIVSSDDYLVSLLKKLNDKDYSKDKESGKANYIIFDKKGSKVVFILCTTENVKGNSKKEGLFIFDSDFVGYLHDKR